MVVKNEKLLENPMQIRQVKSFHGLDAEDKLNAFLATIVSTSVISITLVSDTDYLLVYEKMNYE